jgi:hypothetical protein
LSFRAWTASGGADPTVACLDTSRSLKGIVNIYQSIPEGLDRQFRARLFAVAPRRVPKDIHCRRSRLASSLRV